MVVRSLANKVGFNNIYLGDGIWGSSGPLGSWSQDMKAGKDVMSTMSQDCLGLRSSLS